jgi:hypothetical protein
MVGVSWYLVLFMPFHQFADPTIPAILAFTAVYGLSYGLLQVRFGFINRPEEIILESIQERYGIPIMPVINRIRPY